jgi:ankyrin repeat protein
MKKIFLIVVALFMAMMPFCDASQGFPFPSLPRDMQYEIMLQYIDDEIASLPGATVEYEIAESLKVAADKIRALALANKDLNSIFNQPTFCFKLIKKLAQKFNAFDEEAAQALGTKCAQDRVKLQNNFLDEAVAGYSQFSAAKFEDFIKKGVDLEWTMANGTPLMEAVVNNKLAAVKALIKKGVNINYVDRFGKSALYMTVLIRNYTDPETRKKITIPTSQIIELAKTLLAAGANPNLGFLETMSGGLSEDVSRKEVREFIKAAQKK